jgi:hypothetical protein
MQVFMAAHNRFLKQISKAEQEAKHDKPLHSILEEGVKKNTETDFCAEQIKKLFIEFSRKY